MNELKRIDFQKQEFTAGGRRYLIESGLSIARYSEYQILEKELGFGLTFEDIFKKLKELWKALDKQQFAAAAVMTDNLMRGIARVEERQPVVLKMCALFINEEDEDRGTITKDMMDQKIADWQAENYAIQDFFTLALNSVRGLLSAYKSIARIISENPDGAVASMLNDAENPAS